ncbi:MAG: hypothetical protein J7L64_02705 [Acidobacteria bacterium]|nr:hypothetical protein [Acidobacteriota bacterium]
MAKRILKGLRLIALYAVYGVLWAVLSLLSALEKALESLFARVGEAIYAGR